MAINVNLSQPNPGVSSPGSQNKGQSTSTGSNWSVSNPQNMNSSELELNQAIAQAAANLGSYQYQWGLNQYADTSAMTDASVDNYLTASQQDMNLANQTMQQYQQTTVPEINQQANMAAQYTSPSRLGINMGMAESQSEQGTNAALAAAKQNLQSYGINPNSGEYQELTMANKTAGGAAAAGAGQQAELATEATGRQLLAQSIATGQQLPGQAINAVNSAYQGIGGAENATLANANTGVALTGSANPYMQTAISGKLPPVGNVSSSAGQNTSQCTSEGTSIPVSPPPMVPQVTDAGNPSSGGGGGGGGSGNYTQNISGSYSIGGARGGAIPGGVSFANGGDATQGGYVPQSASPSGGINVDDVPANLNAEEFVIPRDVARWKGEEFWHKEIAKSRAARAKAAATVGPTAGPPQAPGQQPTFTSQSVRGGSQRRFAGGGTTATDTMGSWGAAGSTPAAGASYGGVGTTGLPNTGTPATTPSTTTPSTTPSTTTPSTSPTGYGMGTTTHGGYIGQGNSQLPLGAYGMPLGNPVVTTTPPTTGGGFNPVSISLGRGQWDGAAARGGSIRRMYSGGGI